MAFPVTRHPLRPRHLPILLLTTILGSIGGCSGESNGGRTSAPLTGDAARADAIAREYVDGYYARFPEEAYETGYPDIPWDRLGDRSLDALAAWEGREDAWLAELRALDADQVRRTEAWVPYMFTLQRLGAAAARRVCRTELWNVSPTWTGWQSTLPSTFSQQPVGTSAARADALARLGDVPRYLDTEVANLRRGLEVGYSAPQTNVLAVVRQLDGLLAADVDDSPFFDPARRDGDPTFQDSVRSVIAGRIRPAVARYRDFLRNDYLPRAREEVGVAANPDGEDCYRASVLFWSSLDLSPEEIHLTGNREMQAVGGEMTAVARRLFGDEDVSAALERLRTDPRYTFETGEEVLAYARAAVDRAHEAVPRWFGFVPDARVVVRAFPEFQRQSGGGFYSAGSADGSRPGVYELGTWRPQTISRAGMEATAFHETWPGHHLQMSVALYGGGVHPVLRYLYSAGMAEGWGLYSERLADEMGLYSGDVDRMGMLSNEALRAARLVVDPGLHVLGWSREDAIRYMMEHTAESEGSATAEIDRYIAVPGQATAYLLGSLEIQRLRSEAERRLGDDFDIRAFHDRVLARGAVTLPMLRESVEAWIEERAGG